MNDQTDQQLLRDYAECQSEAAFAELVRRHIDLVYSAAIRMVGDPHLARDVTQGVFVALAQNDRQLTNHPVISGWLHRAAQNIASKIVRTDVRRRAREQEAAAMNELLSTESDAPWEEIAPHLDAALGDLNEPDRDALLLRYFERKSAHEIAQVFGISDEAAQKRVSRAVERLREFFSKRGIAIGASGLIVIVSANAVQAAPVALASTISAAAILGGTAINTSTAITATKAIVMTTLQKIVAAAVLTAAIGTGIYEARHAAELRNQVQALQQQQAPLADEIQQLQRERDNLKSQLDTWAAEDTRSQSNSNESELLKLRGEVAQLRQANAVNTESMTNDSRAGLMKSWLEREDRLKQLVQQYPDKTIPELQLLSEEQWLDAAMTAKFDQDKDIQRTLANLRHTAENNFASLAQPAVAKYAEANGGQFPTDLSQLQPYFKSPVDNSILSRWEILPQSALPNQSMGGDWVITEKTPIDPDLDNRWAIGQNGYGNTSYQTPDVSAAIATIDPAMKAYAAANNGKQPTDPAQILPYLTTPQQQAAYQTLLKKIFTNLPPQ